MLCMLDTFVTDACPLPQRVQHFALQSGHFRHGCLPSAPEGFRCTARQSCLLTANPCDIWFTDKCPPRRKGAGQKRGLAARRGPEARPCCAPCSLPTQQPCAVAQPCRCLLVTRSLVWSGPGRTCSDAKSMFQDATVTSREECLRQNCARLEEHSSGADAAAPNQPHSTPAQWASAAREPPQPLRRALSRAQHFAQTSGTFATDACPLPQRVQHFAQTSGTFATDACPLPQRVQHFALQSGHFRRGCLPTAPEGF